LPLRWIQPLLPILLLLLLLPFVPGDPSAKLEETRETRVSGFTLHRPTEAFEPGDRFWSRPVQDRWIERYPSGITSSFKVIQRSSSDGCDGQIVSNGAVPALELFIPDKGCDRMVIKWRRRAKNWVTRHIGADLKWEDLSLMNDIN
jgi:hypothetical protein